MPYKLEYIKSQSLVKLKISEFCIANFKIHFFFNQSWDTSKPFLQNKWAKISAWNFAHLISWTTLVPVFRPFSRLGCSNSFSTKRKIKCNMYIGREKNPQRKISQKSIPSSQKLYIFLANTLTNFKWSIYLVMKLN